MADQKISELTALTGANVADDDAIAIVDTSATETKKIVFSELKNALDTATGFVRITGDTMTGALDVQSTITADGLTVDGTATTRDDASTTSYYSTDVASNVVTHTSNGTGAFAQEVWRLNDGGTPSERMRLTTTGLGIGTSSPAAALHVDNGAGTRLFVGTANNIYYDGYDHIFRTPSGASTSMTIANSGNVGIGTSSPTRQLDVSKAGTAYIRASDTSSSVGMEMLAASSGGWIGTQTNHSLNFQTNNTERMRIDSSGNLLVGMTSNGITSTGIGLVRDGTSHMYSGGTHTLELGRGTNDGDILKFNRSGATVGYVATISGDIAVGTGNTSLRFYDGTSALLPTGTNGAQRSDAISLGDTNNRFKDLHMSGAAYVGGSGVVGRFGNTTANNYVEVIRTTTSPSYINIGATSAAAIIEGGPRLQFSITDASGSGSSEAMRLDASGNLLVGTTSTGAASGGSGTSGININASGAIEVARSANPVMFVNRTTSDGDIVQFRKNGSTVGSIGVADNGDRIYLAGGGLEGVGIDNGANSFVPTSEAGAFKDNHLSLGQSGARFTDLYLSGGVYLGGTGAANKLDDYEEGLFTPTTTPATSGTITLNTSGDRLSYTKVGRLVTISGMLNVSSVSSPVGSYVHINNLPFTIQALEDTAGRSGQPITFGDNDAGTYVAVGTIALTGGTQIRVYKDASTVAAGDDFYVSYSYFTT